TPGHFAEGVQTFLLDHSTLRRLQLGKRIGKLMSASGHLVFERLILILELLPEVARLKQISNPEENLRRVERLIEKVSRTARQSFTFSLGSCIGSQHQDGQPVIGRNNRSQLLHHLKSVQVKHHQVENDEIRFELFN